MRKVTVVVDTTEFYDHLELRGRSWDQLFELVRLANLEVVVPEVVIREAARHYRRQSTQADRNAITKLRDALKELGRVTAVPELNLADLRAELRGRRDAYEETLRRDLRSRGAKVGPVPNMSAETLLGWAISERQPFKSTGEGFRDSLIWGTVLSAAQDSDRTDLIIFVTANTSDFYGPDGALGADLLDDLSAIKEAPHVVVTRTLAEAFDHLRDELDDAKTARDALVQLSEPLSDADAEAIVEGPVIYACQNLSGRFVDVDARPTLEVAANDGRAVPGHVNVPRYLEDGSLYEVDPIPESLTWSLYDRYSDGRLLGTVTIRADATIEGRLAVSELGDASDEFGIDVLEDIDEEDDDDPARQTVWVTFTVELELSFRATLGSGADNESMESLELETVNQV